MSRLAYSASEVADMLGVSRRTVDRWLAKRELPSFRIGGTVRIPASELAKRMSGKPVAVEPREIDEADEIASEMFSRFRR